MKSEREREVTRETVGEKKETEQRKRQRKSGIWGKEKKRNARQKG